MSGLNAEQLDAVRELINIGVGRAAAILNQMTHVHVTLHVPVVHVLNHRDLKAYLPELDNSTVAGVQIGFKGPFSGTAALVFPPVSASNLVATLTGEEAADEDLDALRIGTLTEVGNIVVNGVLGSISNILRQTVKYSVPTFYEGDTDHVLSPERVARDGTVLLAHISFDLEQLLVRGNIVFLFEVGSFEAIAQAIDAIAGEDV